MAHTGRLVTTEELLDTLWAETAVSDAALKVRIAELRKALGETAETPWFLATVLQWGYRCIAPVTVVSMSEVDIPSPPAAVSWPEFQSPSRVPLPLIDREAVLEHLHALLAQARQGRQSAFSTGEPGIGKTAAVGTFLAQSRTGPSLSIATGQGVEHHGTGEAYRPILDAQGQLCRQRDGDRLVHLLRQQAPTWLVQLPWLLTMADRTLLQHELQGITRERMLREFAEVVHTLTVRTPLLLVLEDLHWSDYATLDLLTFLARRRTPTRLLLLGTYRPGDTVVQELRQHGYGTALPCPY